jgi:Tol biopolymer transport system component
MKKLLIAILAASVLAVGTQSGNDLFQKALLMERTEGNLPEAIKLYQRIVDKYAGDRKLAAQALMQMAQCYEKLGQAEARKTYERLVRDYADQRELAADARLRLAALQAESKTRPEMSVRRVWVGREVDNEGQVSPDGHFLSFTDWETGDLAIHDLATGQNRRITSKGSWAASPEWAELSVVSPDSKQIGYTWYNRNGSYDLRVIGIDGSKPRVLYTNKEQLFHISPEAWTPDGKHILAEIVRSSGNREMVLIGIGDGSVQVVKYPGGAFSPDGRFIAYGRTGGISLFEVETGRELPLIQEPAGHTVLGWAPDGRRILFASDRSGSRDAWLIAVSDGKAQGPPELVKKDFSGLTMGFTRSGAFYYVVPNTVRDVRIAELDPASGKVISPPQPASRRWIGITLAPDWSPDGKFLAYICERSLLMTSPLNPTMVVRSTETGEERELNPKLKKVGYSRLRWTPDGKSIIVAAFESGSNDLKLLRVDAQTGEATLFMPLTLGERGGVPRFDLSPDGKAIFHLVPDTENMNQSSLLVRDLQTGQETALIRQKSVYSVSVSPDGQWLILGAEDEKSQVLLVMPATGGDTRELVRIDAEEANYRVEPFWTPDGRHIIFVKGARGRSTRDVQVWQVSAEGGEPQRLGLTIDELWWLRLHPDGRRFAFGTWEQKFELWVMENFLPARNAAR